MRALLDVNVLIALHDRDHVHHVRAGTWLAGNIAHGWASCPLTQNGCLRIMSQPAYPNPQPLSMLVSMLQGASANPHHAFWPDDVSLADPQRFDSARILGPKQLTDIYLLALAVKNGGRLATLDRAVSIAAVRGAETRHVVVI